MIDEHIKLLYSYLLDDEYTICDYAFHHTLIPWRVFSSNPISNDILSFDCWLEDWCIENKIKPKKYAKHKWVKNYRKKMYYMENYKI